MGETVNGVYYKNGIDAFNSWLSGVSDGGLTDKERQSLATGLSQGKISQSQYNSLLGNDIVVGGYQAPTPYVAPTPAPEPTRGLLTPDTSVGVRNFSDATAIDLNNQLADKMGGYTAPLDSADALYQWYTSNPDLSNASYSDQVMYHYLKSRDIGSKDGDAGRKYFNDMQSQLADQFGLPQQIDVGDGRLDIFYGQKQFTTNPFQDAIDNASKIGGYYDMDGDMGQFGKAMGTVGPIATIAAAVAGQPWLAAALSGATTGATGGSTADVLKSAGTSLIASQLPSSGLFDGLPTNSFIQGAATGGTVSGLQGLVNGDVSLKGIGVGALTGGVANSFMDYMSDALTAPDRATLDLAYQNGQISPTEYANAIINDARNVSGFSDLGGLVGPNGLLGGNYVSGEPLVNSLNWLADNTPSAILDGLGTLVDSGMDFGKAAGFIDPTHDEFGNLTDFGKETVLGPYDQRFYDFAAEYDKNASPLYGPYESNPYNPSTSGGILDAIDAALKDSGTSFQDFSLPGLDGLISSIQDLMPDQELAGGDSEIATDTTGGVPDGSLPSGNGNGDIVAGGYNPDSTLTSGTDSTLPSGTDSTLPSSGEVVVGGYDIGDGVIPTSGGDGSETQLPGGSDGGIGDLLAGAGISVGSADYEKFMSGITYIMPELINNQIPIKDFVIEYIRAMKA